MKIIISPAKKMRVQTDIIEETGMPVFLEDAKRLHDILKAYSMEQLKKLFGANDAITRQNYERYQTMDLEPYWLMSASSTSPWLPIFSPVPSGNM